MWKNILLMVLCTIFALCLSELVLILTGMARSEKKIWTSARELERYAGRDMFKSFEEESCYLNCYTSNPAGYFPFKVQVPASFVFPDAGEGSSSLDVYCLPYACQKRRDGFFAGRKKDVFLVGDSFTFGEGVKDEDTLGYLLGEKFKDYNFKNFGETGSDVHAVNEQFKKLCASIRPAPQNIIYFYNLNDALMSPDTAAGQRSIMDFENLEMRPPAPTIKLFGLIKKAMVINRETSLSIQNYRDVYFSPRNTASLRRGLGELQAMHGLAKQDGIKFTVVIYPLLYKDFLGRYPFLKIHDLLMGFCEENHINCIDGYNAFKDSYSLAPFTVHPVDFHPNGKANRRLVDYLSTQQARWLNQDATRD